MGVIDSMLVKYGAVLVGYAIVGLPVFGPGSAEYIKKIGTDPSAITRDYVRNSSLLINLAKAIGRLVISYKEIQQLAGYTTLVHEMNVQSIINLGSTFGPGEWKVRSNPSYAGKVREACSSCRSHHRQGHPHRD